MAFYIPINQKISWIPVFSFLDEWVEDVLERKKEVYIEHIEKVIWLAEDILDAEYYVVFLWKDGADLMSDVWAHDQVEKRWSWPLTDVRIFRNYDIESSIWVWSGNTLRTLWDIEEWRLQCKKYNDDFFSETPVIDEELLLGEDFC